jgi:hypothetical protein
MVDPTHVDDDGNLAEGHTTWWDRNWLKVCLGALFIWTSLGFVLIQTERSDRVDQAIEFSQDLRTGLIKSCDRNGNPLREAVQRILRQEIAQSQSPLLYEFFPQIPRARLEALIVEQNKERREIIAEIQPVDCAQQYPHVER